MSEQPNIVVVMSDDHGHWALGCSGNGEIQTPNLDYLAETGTRLTNAFTTNPVCSPSRASFWTGRLPSQHGVHDFIAGPGRGFKSREWLDRETTLAQILKRAGYRTGLVGKWHLSGRDPQPGFDFWYRHELRTAELDAYWKAESGFLGGLGGGPAPEGGNRSVEAFLSQEPGYDRHAVTDRAVEFLREGKQEPFFLFVGYTATHSPWTGHPERLVSRFRRLQFDDIPADPPYSRGRLVGEATFDTARNQPEARAQYYAAVAEVDVGVGRILDELERGGVRERTLVVYMSDHGLNCGHHGLWGKGNCTRPLNFLEESIRVPSIWNLPGVVRAQVRDEMVDHCDVFQTLVEMAEARAELPARAYPGHSFAELLRGGPAPAWPDAIFAEYGDSRMIRTARHKLIRRHSGPADELYDLEADPRETVNLLEGGGLGQVAEDLQQRLTEHFARFEDPERSGLRVRELPAHNPVEAWRGLP